MNKFLKYTTQDEPAISGAFVGAIILAVLSRYLNLTEDDLMLLGPIALIIGGFVIRQGVFSPATVKKLTGRNVQPPDGAVQPPPQ